MDPVNKELQELVTDFRTHEAVCEERWKTIFNEVRDAASDSKDRNHDMKESLNKLHRLVWSVGGALILFLSGIVVSGNVL